MHASTDRSLRLGLAASFAISIILDNFCQGNKSSLSLTVSLSFVLMLVTVLANRRIGTFLVLFDGTF